MSDPASKRSLSLVHVFDYVVRDHNAPSVGDPFKETCDAFAANIQRTKSTFMTLIFLLVFVRNWERAEVTEEIETAGTFSPRVRREKYQPERWRRVSEIFSTHQTEELKLQHTDQYFEWTDFWIRDAFARIETSSTSASLVPGYRSLLSGLVLNMWTTFEALAGDLWEAALNNHPAGLSELKGSARRIAKKQTANFSGGASPQDEGKVVSLQFLNRYQYDLRKVMGTVLRNKFAFDRLEGIREAYATAFFERSVEIDALLSDQALDSLSVLRNVIVHRGSVADQEYLRRASALGLPIVAVGQMIELDGAIVAPLIEKVAERSAELLVAVSKWCES